MSDFNTNVFLDDIKKRMENTFENLKKEFNTLRTGRASVTLLDSIFVDAYGSPTPISQVSTISVPESRLISIQVWDRGMVKSVEKAILESELGLNPLVDGTLIRLPVPTMNEERRRELTKVASKYAEASKVTLRSVRRDGMDTLKSQEKEKKISEDDLERISKEVQTFTDTYVEKVESLTQQKHKDIMHV